MEFETATWVLGTPSHSWQAVAQSGMSIGHKSLIVAAKTIAGSALNLLTKPAVLRKVRAEFAQVTKGKVYKCPIAAGVKPLELARSRS